MRRCLFGPEVNAESVWDWMKQWREDGTTRSCRMRIQGQCTYLEAAMLALTWAAMTCVIKTGISM